MLLALGAATALGTAATAPARGVDSTATCIGKVGTILAEPDAPSA